MMSKWCVLAAAFAMVMWPALAEEPECEAAGPEEAEHVEQAAHAREWLADIEAHLDEMRAQLPMTPPELAKALEHGIALREEMAGAVREKLEGHEARNWDVVHEAQGRMEDLEAALRANELDLEEARMVLDVRRTAEELDLGEQGDEMAAQVNEQFDALREVRAEMAALRERERAIRRGLERVFRQMELAELERAADRLRTELAEE